MRMAEARITLGVVKAREGDLEWEIELGTRTLPEERKSLPSLLMVSRDLTKMLKNHYPNESQTRDYLDELAALAPETAIGR